jgi:hypothetical protein
MSAGKCPRSGFSEIKICGALPRHLYVITPLLIFDRRWLKAPVKSDISLAILAAGFVVFWGWAFGRPSRGMRDVAPAAPTLASLSGLNDKSRSRKDRLGGRATCWKPRGGSYAGFPFATSSGVAQFAQTFSARGQSSGPLRRVLTGNC